jgi:hypothetical protein
MGASERATAERDSRDEAIADGGSPPPPSSGAAALDIDKGDGAFPDDQGRTPTVADDVVARPRRIDDQGAGVMRAPGVALRTGQNEDMLEPLMAVARYPSAGRISQKGSGGPNAVVKSIEPVLVNAGAQNSP